MSIRAGVSGDEGVREERGKNEPVAVEMSRDRVVVPREDLVRVVGLIAHRVDLSKRHVSDWTKRGERESAAVPADVRTHDLPIQAR